MTQKRLIDLKNVLRDSKIAVIPTDTIYGIVATALKQEVVERLYQIRQRDYFKPFIILISNIDDIKLFGIAIEPYRKVFEKYWPGPVSLILPCESDRYQYLHRGTKSLAFRLPKLRWLRNIISITGPLIAPSANRQGQPPAKDIKTARKYFGHNVDYYLDDGIINNKKPSKIISLLSGQEQVIRS